MPYRFGPFELDQASFELRRDGALISLERRPFDLLVYLIRHRERVVPDKELLANVWRGASVTRSSLTRAVRLVRRALRDSAQSRQWIATAHGRGYRFVGALDVDREATAGERTQQDPFVGRRAELTSLEQMLDDACRGRGGVCLIAGGPGVGKTRLGEQVRARAEARAMSVLSAWCQDGEGAPAYWPWIQLVRSHAARQDPDQLREDLGPHVDVVASVSSELAAAELSSPRGRAQLAGDDARFRLFDGVSQMFLAGARRRPLLLVIDDLHNVDAPSLRLLDFLARELADAPLLLVAAHRSAAVDLPDRVRDVLASVSRHRYCVRLELAGLAPGDVHALARAADVDLDVDQVERIHRRTGGNPLFVRELVRHAALSGGCMSEDLLPDAIRDLLQVRLALLSEQTRTLLEAASIVGSEWADDLVYAVVDLDADGSARALDEALAAGVIRRCPPILGRFAFAHALFREALYTALPSDRRRRLHGRAAAWLAAERGSVDSGEVAYHAHHSAELDRGRAALQWTMRAAVSAMSRLAYEDAADHHARGLELLERFRNERENELRCELLVGLGEARMASGDRPLATKVLLEAARLARALRSGPMLARCALGLAPGLLSLEIKTESGPLVALLTEALELCADDVELESRLLARLSVAQMWSSKRGETLAIAERAVKLARESQSAPAEAFARSARFFVRWTPDNLEERVLEAPELLASVTRGHDGELAVLCRVARFATLLEAGDLHAAHVEIDALDELAEELRQPQALWCRVLLRAALAYLHGAFEEAARLRTEFARAADRVGDINALHAAAVFDILIAWDQGRDADALELVNHAVTLHSDWENVRAHALARCGHHDEARELLNHLCAGQFLDFDLDWLVFMVNRVEACAFLDDRELAAVLYEALLPCRGRIVVVGYGWASWGALDRSLGVLAALLYRWSDAEEHFAAALRLNRRLGARPFVARTQHDFARMLRARGDPSGRARSEQLIATALADVRTLGMTWLTGRLEALAGG